MNVKVPDIGDASEVEVIEVSVAVGDTVEEGDTLIVLESDKASMEIPAPQGGVIQQILIKEGDQVNEGADIVVMAGAQSMAAEPAPAAAEPAAPQAAATAAPAAASQVARVPDIGEASDVEVIEVSVAVGDSVEEGDTLIVLESDKASMEIPSPVSGVVQSLVVAEGAKVGEGDEIATIASAGAAPAAAPEPVAQEAAPAQAPAPVAAPAASASVQVSVPDIGEATDVEVIEVSVSAGDSVSEGDTLIVLESDKASMEIPAPADGVIESITVKEGDKVSEGTAIATLASAGAAPAAAPAPVAAPAAAPIADKAAAPSATAPAKPPTAGPTSPAIDVHAGPAVRAMARDLGVDLGRVTPTGPRNRVLKEDVQNFVKQAMANPATAAPAASGSVASNGIPVVKLPDFSKFGPVTREKMSKLHKVTADNMTKSWLNVPAVTQFDEVDITELEAFRKAKKAAAEKAGVKLTPLPFMIKAVATVLRELPQFNVALDMESGEIIKKDYVHVGMAVDTPAGLMVPVIRDADKKSIYDIARETIVLAGKARDRKLTAADMTGGCFTISSLGSIGGTQFTPIVNNPEVAIMGVSKASMQPVWDGKGFEPRLIMPISLSYDHRAVNGADGARFTTRMGQLLGDIRELLL